MNIEMMRKWTKNYNKIEILSSCEWFFDFLQRIPLLQALDASMTNILPQRTPTFTEKISI